MTLSEPAIGDYYPGYDCRKDLSEIWQDHAPLPDVDFQQIYKALIAVAQYGYKQRMDEEL